MRAAAHVRDCWRRLLEWLPDVRAHAARCWRSCFGACLATTSDTQLVEMGETARTSCDRHSWLLVAAAHPQLLAAAVRVSAAS
jgi:hypothetical protein